MLSANEAYSDDLLLLTLSGRAEATDDPVPLSLCLALSETADDLVSLSLSVSLSLEQRVTGDQLLGKKRF